jgi:hypothetical protein
VVGDLFAVHANPLVDFFKMRRGVEPGPKTRSAKNRFQKGSGRTLAIGSRDMRGGIGAVRPAKPLRENSNVFEIEFRGSGLRGRGLFPA